MSVESLRFGAMLPIYGRRLDTPFSAYLKVARLAEECGFDGLFAVDHLYMSGGLIASRESDPDRPYFIDVWTTLAAIAARTERIQFGPMVTPLSLRPPAFVAKHGGTLDIVSNGRFVLSVGAGWNREEYEAFGFAFDESFKVRHAKTIEGVEVIRRLWTEDQPVTYRGKYFQLEAAPFWPKPIQQPHPPIWFGGMGPTMRQAIPVYADGWVPAAPHHRGVAPRFYKQAWQEITDAATKAGRDASQLTPALLIYSSAAEDRDQARGVVQRMAERRPEWAAVPLDEYGEQGMAIMGDPKDCIRDLERFIDAGVRYFIFSFLPSSLEVTANSMQFYRDHILPYFRS